MMDAQSCVSDGLGAFRGCHNTQTIFFILSPRLVYQRREGQFISSQFETANLYSTFMFGGSVRYANTNMLPL